MKNLIVIGLVTLAMNGCATRTPVKITSESQAFAPERTLVCKEKTPALVSVDMTLSQRKSEFVDDKSSCLVINRQEHFDILHSEGQYTVIQYSDWNHPLERYYAPYYIDYQLFSNFTDKQQQARVDAVTAYAQAKLSIKENKVKAKLAMEKRAQLARQKERNKELLAQKREVEKIEARERKRSARLNAMSKKKGYKGYKDESIINVMDGLYADGSHYQEYKNYVINDYSTLSGECKATQVLSTDVIYGCNYTRTHYQYRGGYGPHYDTYDQHPTMFIVAKKPNEEVAPNTPLSYDYYYSITGLYTYTTVMGSTNTIYRVKKVNIK